jgi:hypothetical protein
MDIQPDPAKIDFLLLCDHAEVANGKLTAMGIGWDTIQQPFAPRIPGMAAMRPPPIRMAVGLGFSVGWNFTNQPIPLEVVLEDSEGKPLFKVAAQLTAGRAPNQPVGTPVRSVLAFPLLITFPTSGRYRVLASLPQHGSHMEWGFTVLPPPEPPQITFASPSALLPLTPPATP